jgi:hypothetical protein
MSRIGKSVETESRLVASYGWLGKREGEGRVNGGVSATGFLGLMEMF